MDLGRNLIRRNLFISEEKWKYNVIFQGDNEPILLQTPCYKRNFYPVNNFDQLKYLHKFSNNFIHKTLDFRW